MALSIRSYNGTNFKMEEVQQLFSFRNVEWNFIPPAINWWGGAYERIKRCVKPCLEKVLCRNAAMGTNT